MKGSDPEVSFTAELPEEEGVHSILDEIIYETGVPAIGVEIRVGDRRIGVSRGSAVANRGVPLNVGSRFEISCLMKFFISLAALEAGADGILDLTAPLSAYLPELRNPKVSPAAEPNVLHLISHTSGLIGPDVFSPHVTWNYSWEKYVAFMQETDPLFSPGDFLNYDHVEHVILGEILRKQYNRSPRDIVVERILTPVGAALSTSKSDFHEGVAFVSPHGVSSQTFQYAPISQPSRCSFWEASLPNATMSLKAIADVVHALMAIHRSRQPQPFRASTLKCLERQVIKVPTEIHSGMWQEVIPQSFGLGCAKYIGNFLGHNGSSQGQACAVRFNVEGDIILVVGTNAYNTQARDMTIGRLLSATCSAYPKTVAFGASGERAGVEDLLGRFTPGQVIGEYIGSFLGGGTVSATEQTITFELGTGKMRTKMIANLNDGKFKLEPNSESFRFLSDPTTGRPMIAKGVFVYRKVQT